MVIFLGEKKNFSMPEEELCGLVVRDLCLVFHNFDNNGLIELDILPYFLVVWNRPCLAYILQIQFVAGYLCWRIVILKK